MQLGDPLSRGEGSANPGPGAYWFWGDLPAEPEMRRQLRDFRDQGFSVIYIQARHSMPAGLYLSEAYLSAYALAVTIMAELGLKAGLYDDYAWTSGQACGRTVEGADHLRETHLFHATTNGVTAQISGIIATLGASLGPAVRNWIHDGGTPVFTDWRLVAAVLWLPDGGIRDVTAQVTLQDPRGDGVSARLGADLPPGARWSLFASAHASNSRIINYLLPEAGARFVEKGLEPYARALKGLMPDPVSLLFFDQPAPALYRWNETSGNLGNSLLWSDALEAALGSGGRLWQHLAALLFSIGDETASLRSRVYRLYNDMIQQAFFAPLRAFCDRNGLQLTGHEILPHVASFALNGGFSGIDPRVALAADFFGIDRWRDVTAVDVNNLDPQLAPMLGHSIARASGRKGCLTELYVTALRSETRAAGQWEMVPQALRAQLVRLHLLGASQVILHGLFASEGDARPLPLENMRFDFAPGFNLEPWWPVMAALSEEIGALARFVEAADPVCQIAVLYPYETALVEGPKHRHAQEFGAWCEALFTLGHLPLILDEAGLARITEGPEGPMLYGSRIAALVLPGVTALADPESPARLVRLEAAGLPLWREPPGAGLGESLPALIGGPQVRPVPGLRAVPAGRDGEGWWRLVLFNDSDLPAETRLSLGEGFLCEEGEAQSDPLQSDPLPSGPFTDLALRLEPQELRCLRLREARATSSEPLPAVPAPQVMELAEGWSLQTEGPPRPISVLRGWQEQGDPSWSGIGRYETGFTLAEAAELVLELPGLACAAFVTLDGTARGALWHAPWRMALGPVAAGAHRLRLDVANTAANRYYADTPYAGTLWPDVSGLTAPPRLLLVPLASDPS